MQTIEEINAAIKNVDSNQVSDGYHTFGELYGHRIGLFVTLCRLLDFMGRPVWRSLKHSDGTGFEGWFIMGINKEPGTQITYHLPMSKWDDTNFVETLDLAPQWDGYTADEALARLGLIVEGLMEK